MPAPTVSLQTTPANASRPVRGQSCESSPIATQHPSAPESPVSIQKRSPYQHTPASLGGASVTHNPRLGLVFVPDYDHCSTTPFARSSESCPRPNIGIPRPRYERPRLQASSSVRAEHGVDRLSRVGVPSHRAYLLPQSRTSSDRGHTSPTPSYLAGRLRTATPAGSLSGLSTRLVYWRGECARRWE